MSIYFIVIIGVILFEYVLSFIVRTLNIQALDPNLPKAFADTFDEDSLIASNKVYVPLTFVSQVEKGYLAATPTST